MSYEQLRETTLAEVPGELAFRACQGDLVQNVYQLSESVARMSDEEFRHHVDAAGEENHFADWVENVLQNPGLAKDLRFENNHESKEQFVKTVQDHVAWLERL